MSDQSHLWFNNINQLKIFLGENNYKFRDIELFNNSTQNRNSSYIRSCIGRMSHSWILKDIDKCLKLFFSKINIGMILCWNNTIENVLEYLYDVPNELIWLYSKFIPHDKRLVLFEDFNNLVYYIRFNTLDDYICASKNKSFMDIAYIYNGLGWYYVVSFDRNTYRYFIRTDGGSNKCDYEANEKFYKKYVMPSHKGLELYEILQHIKDKKIRNILVSRRIGIHFI